MGIGHLFFATDTFAIIFDQDVGQDSFGNVVVLFVAAAEEDLAFGE